jgi:UDPglucose 6-dehydrogenase
MNITIIGTGYVGLVTGACFANNAVNVTCLDIDTARVNSLNQGDIPFHEPGLEELVLSGSKKQKLTFTDSYKEGCKNSIFFLCVGTPDRGDGESDLSGLISVLDSLAENLKGKNFIITKSTVPLGTNRFIEDYLGKNLNNDASIEVLSNPEFLKEGSAVLDFMKPDRIVVGCDSEASIDLIKELYQPFNWSSDRLIFMTIESAELTKYAANSFLATKISFMNEMAKICEQTGANIHDIRKGIGTDSRIGLPFLYAGLGYGGSCFPKDIKALIQTQKKLGISPKLLRSTEEINAAQFHDFIEKIKTNTKDLKNKVFTVWGLSFKPNTDDVRESVAIKLVKELSPQVKFLRLYDPVANDNARIELSGIPNIEFCDDKDKALVGSDALIIATEWKEFWDVDINSLSTLRDKLIFDGRNILNSKKLIDNNFKYIGVGT